LHALHRLGRFSLIVITGGIEVFGDITRSGVTRRTVLRGGMAISAFALTATLVPTGRAVAASSSDFARVRDQWRDTLIGDYDLSDPVIQKYVADSAAAAQPFWTSMNTSAGHTYLWSDLDSSNTSAVQRNNIGRLRTLALALKSPGSSLAGNAQLKSDLLSALDWFLANKYGLSVHSYDNWWDWQIGIPLALADFCVLMYDDLTPAQLSTAMSAIAHYEPDPTRTGGATSTGANRNWTCSNAILRGALSEDAAVIDNAISAIATIFPYATSGDGFYRDGGFIQHTFFAYTGGYGVSLLQYLTYAVIATSGTPWAFSAEQTSEVFDWTQKNYRPWMYAGALMDMNRGRGLSRFYETDHRIGRLTIATLLQLADALPAAQALTLRSQCKGWIAADSYQPFFDFDPVPIEQVRLSSIVAGRKVLTNASIATAAESTTSIVSPSIARAVHRRPEFAFAVAMDTVKIKPYESANQENLQGWYTGEGAVYMYLPNQLGHWPNEYWPTADKYRIPGTTVTSRELALGKGRTTDNTWAGGALLEGNAAIGMPLVYSILKARKSWFCIGDVIVCLGAGITSTDSGTIQTTIEQRNIGPNGRTVPIIDGDAALSTPSSTPTTLTPKWAWIPNACGYVFPEGSTIKVMRNDRTGKWTDMDHRGVYDDDTLYSRRFITFWFDHGVQPTDATYAYIQMPGASEEATAAMATSPDVTVVANTDQVQAATRAIGGGSVTMANFWSADAPKTAGIKVDKPASVVVSRRGRQLAVAVSDPTQKLTETITVTIDGSFGNVSSTDPGVNVLATSPNIVISVPMTSSAGKTFVARFEVAAPPDGGKPTQSR
jgi:hyaluronate lyase